MAIRDRIRELRRVRAGELVPHPRNWRKHTEEQTATLRGVLREIGYADAILARELPDGRLQIIDGHLRADLDPKQTVPVLVLDVSEAEAGKLLLTLDPLAAMAESDAAKLAELAAEVTTSDAALQALIDSLVPAADTGPVELKQVSVQPPPRMSWVLIGIETVRFGQIAELVEDLAAVEGIILESTSNGKDQAD